MSRRISLFVLLALLAGCGASLPRVAGPAPKAAPELKRWEVWSGEWVFKGTARDTPTSPEYQLDWTMRGRWILDGYALEVTSVWKGGGQTLHVLEVLTYDPGKKANVLYGFCSDGSLWVGGGTFEPGTVIETGSGPMLDGKVMSFRNVWTFGPDGMTVSGKADQELDGVKFVGFTVTGTRRSR
jgi:hypothetical protein